VPNGLSQLRTVAQLTNKMVDDVWRAASRFKRVYLSQAGHAPIISGWLGVKVINWEERGSRCTGYRQHRPL